MKKAYLLRGLVVLILTYVVFFSIITPSEIKPGILILLCFLLILLALVLWGVEELVYTTAFEKIQYWIMAPIMEKKGITYLKKSIRESVKEKSNQIYEDQKKTASQTPQEKYSKESDVLFKKIKRKKGEADKEIDEGMDLLRMSTPQKDWALAGGLAAGIGGGALGAAVAVNIMQENAAATARQHELGKKMIERGEERYQMYQDNEDKNFSHYESFVYGPANPTLVEHLKVNVWELKNLGVGYVQALMSINADRNFPFLKTKKKAAIDGAVVVELYNKDGTELMASGYYSGPGRQGNDRAKSGFQPIDSQVIFLKEEEGKSFNKLEGYQVKLSSPNLWLLKLEK
jgi:hypothetical protein